MDVEASPRITRRLNFDDWDERNLSSPEGDVHMPDLSIIRRLGKMGVGDDSAISLTQSSYLGGSPDALESIADFPEENICLWPSSPSSPSPNSSRPFFNPQNCSTPGPTKRISGGRRGRISNGELGEVPRTPIKETRFRQRISALGDSLLDGGGIYGIQEECSNNPFTDNADFMESPEKPLKKQQTPRKRSLAQIHSTPILKKKIDGLHLTPESCYESRPKVAKHDKVQFSLGCSPSVSPVPSDSSPSNRYMDEFVELETIGAGNFGRVTKVRKRLDGVIYSVKRTRDEGRLRDCSDAKIEVWALAVISHPNVLRYFSSWRDPADNWLYIQSEYCDAGTLAHRIKVNLGLHLPFAEDEMRRMMRQCAAGLASLHELLLVHLDVKPDNIFMTHRRRTSSPKDCDVTEEDLGRYTYKIGDLGHVRSFKSGRVTNFMDGDKRYLAPEILHQLADVLDDPTKADVYSLGITAFETASVGRTSGHPDLSVAQRNGIIPGIPAFPLSFNQLFQRMTAMTPFSRPSMYEVIADPTLKKPAPGLRQPGMTHSQSQQTAAPNSIRPKALPFGRRLPNRSASNQF